ncbi:hypothetical protein MMC34_001114 [Xylographa carneopallida]|nr:hypothetical protein [Xylographa carneopallida]
MFTRALARLIGLEPDDSRAGDDVWFARDIQQGQLQSLMLVTQCVKIKLQRLPTTGQYELQCYHMPGWTPDKASQEIARKRRVLKYQCDRWVITQIGHARLARAEVQQHCDALRAGYAPYISWAQARTSSAAMCRLAVAPGQHGSAPPVGGPAAPAAAAPGGGLPAAETGGTAMQRYPAGGPLRHDSRHQPPDQSELSDPAQPAADDEQPE